MKFNIGTKIYGGYTLALIMFVFIGVTSYLNTKSLIKDTEWVTHTNHVKFEISSVLSALQDAETGQRGYIITGIESYLEPYNAGTDSVQRRLTYLRNLISDNKNQTRGTDKLTPLINSKIAEMATVIQLRRTKGAAAAEKLVETGEGKKIMDDIRGVLAEMTNEEDSLLIQRSAKANIASQTTLSTILYGIPIIVILLALVGIIITQNITKPLRQITNTAELIANGDLSGNIAFPRRGDEVGVLMRAFSNMTKYLRDMIETTEQIASGNLTTVVKPKSGSDALGNSISKMIETNREQIKGILNGVNVIASTSSEILASTTQIASGSAETATAISETTTTVEEVRQAAQLSSQKANNLSDSANRVAQVSQNGRKAVDETVNGMNHIRKQMDEIAQAVIRLSEQSQSIGGIIASVTDLADQSNLLAVNAAIEAARAGEQGKGFAVVAQEIRNLAEQSKQATMQVRNILNDVQKATGAVVLATEQGNKAVEEGVKKSEEAGEAIRILAESSGEAVQVSTQIVASSQQQLVGMDQIGMAMQNINQAGIETAASMTQAEESVKNLHELGQKLKELVEQFKM